MIRPYQGILPTIPASCYIDVSAQVIGDVVLGEHATHPGALGGVAKRRPARLILSAQVRYQHGDQGARRVKARSFTCSELEGIEQSGPGVAGTERAAALAVVDERNRGGIDADQLQGCAAQPICRRRAPLTPDEHVVQGVFHGRLGAARATTARNEQR